MIDVNVTVNKIKYLYLLNIQGCSTLVTNVYNTNTPRFPYYTPGETENEWQKTEQVLILLLRSSRSFFDAKKMKKKNC